MFNPINFAVYHYAGNNPIKYTDPDGNQDTPSSNRVDLGKFKITVYNYAHESEHPDTGKVMANGLGKEYNIDFLKDIRLQGTGIDKDGKLITIDWSKGKPKNSFETTFFKYGGGIGASGHKVVEEISVAVDPKVIKLGTWINIDGVGLRRADDTGSDINGKHIDLYKDVTHKEALNQGVSYNEVYQNVDK